MQCSVTPSVTASLTLERHGYSLWHTAGAMGSTCMLLVSASPRIIMALIFVLMALLVVFMALVVVFMALVVVFMALVVVFMALVVVLMALVVVFMALIVVKRTEVAQLVLFIRGMLAQLE